MRFAHGYLSVRAVAALTCILLAAAGAVVAISWQRPRPMDTQPEGIVALSPALTNLLFQIGAGDEVTGVSRFSRLPAGENRKIVGDNMMINREVVLWLQPRVVVYQQGKTDALKQLESDGIQLEEFRIDTLGDLNEAISRLGRIAKHAQADAAIARIKADLAQVSEKVAHRGPPPKVLLLMAGRAAGRDTFLDELLAIAGGRNVAPITGYPTVNDEQIVAWAPQVIVEIDEGLEHASAAELAARRVAWNRLANVPAVAAGQVYVLINPALTIPDANVGRTALAFARCIHPEAFEAVPAATEPASKPD